MTDIDYSKIIKRSWFLTWKNKWLWVMGLVLAAFGGGGSSGGGGGSNGSTSSNFGPTSTPQPYFEEIKNQTTTVLGEATNTVINWFSNVPLQNWVMLVLAILLFAIFTTLVSWVIVSWAKGALIWGLQEADMGLEVNLKTVSPKGKAKIKPLIVFRLISFGVSLAVVLALVLVIGLGFAVKLVLPVLGTIWIILFGIAGSLAFILAFVLMVMLSIYAERLIILANYSAWEAWKSGLTLSKSNFITTACMGLINSAIGCGAGCGGLVILLLIFGLPVYLLISPIIKNGIESINPIQIFGIIIIVFLFFTINTLLKAILLVFNYGNWNLIFKEIFLEKNNKHESK